MEITYTAMPTATARAYQGGAPDAYGNLPEKHVSDGGGYQCRHCLSIIPEGFEMLLVAYRPFEKLDAYAETGPVFICAGRCKGYETKFALPPALQASPEFLLKGYGADDRIVYGTGAVTPTARIPARAAAVFADPKVAYIHVRSSRNNCYQARIERG